MATLASRVARLSRLERTAKERKKGRPELRLFWPDDLTPCRLHLRCDVERATGEHLVNVLHLGWGSAQA